MYKQKAKMKQNKILKGSRGITLIALVITIIVLLILAAVSIATLTGENGILTQATRAREETRGGEVDESIKLWKTEKQTNKLTGGTTTNKSKEELLEELKDNKLLTEEEYQSLLNGEEITIGSRTISIEEAKTVVEAFNAGEIEVGDYLDYKNPSIKSVTVGTEETGYSQEQTYKVDEKTTWRVLELDEEGDNLLLISGSPIKRSKVNGENTDDPYLALGGAEAWFNCKETLDKICNIYKNDLADEVRSMTIEDVTRALRNNNK